MSQDARNTNDTSLRKASVDFMDFLCRAIRNEILDEELEDFKTKVNLLEQDATFNESIVFFSEKDFAKKYIGEFSLPKEYHVPAVFIIVRKMLPQYEIPASLKLRDAENDLKRIAEVCGVLFDIGKSTS